MTAGAELDRAIGAELDSLREAGTYKHANVLRSPQGPVVEMEGRGEVLVLSSNNYLGLAARPEVVEAGIEGLRRYGAGTASVLVGLEGEIIVRSADRQDALRPGEVLLLPATIGRVECVPSGPYVMLESVPL